MFARHRPATRQGPRRHNVSQHMRAPHGDQARDTALHKLRSPSQQVDAKTMKHLGWLVAYMLIHAILAPVLVPLAALLPVTQRASLNQFRSAHLSRVAKKVAKSSYLQTTGDCLLKERAIVICNHQSFWDLIVVLLLAAPVNASVSFCLRGRMVSFLTVRTWIAYFFGRAQPLRVQGTQDWIIVFPEQQRYTPNEAVRARGTRNLLRANFDEVGQILAQTPIDALYDLTLYYGSKVGALADPHLSGSTYCSVTVRRFDAYDFKRKSARRQQQFLQALWTRKDDHLSVLKKS